MIRASMEPMLIGEFGLWFLVVVAGVSVVAPDRANRYRLDIVLATLATGLLIVLAGAFVVEAWSLVYVADHARSGINPLLRLSGVWAGPEGSLLLWATMVAWASVLARNTVASTADLGIERWAIRLGALLTGGYGLVLVSAADPFERLAVPPVDGLGLQPVLENPAMVWHPPILYAGLTGLLVPALATAATALGRTIDRPGPAPVLDRRVLAIPLWLLTVGLATGAVWANLELGWGGYWAWDPIESAGLVAWLFGVAALHARSAHERSAHGRSTRGATMSSPLTVAVLILPGVAAIWATTVTRVGVVASVHAFADRPGLRLGLLAVAGVASVGAILIMSQTRPGAPPSVAPPAVGTRTTPAVHRQWATATLAAAAVTIAIGTYEPLVEGVTSGDRVAIAGHYYTRLLWPVVVVGAALAVKVDRRWLPALVGAVIGVVVTPLATGPFAIALAAAGGAVAGSAFSLLAAPRPGALAHLGVGLVLIGIGGTIATEVTTIDLATDRPTMVDGRELVHRSITITESAGTRQAVATLEIDGTPFEPRLVSFPLRGASTAEMARRLDGLDELQVILIDGDASRARYRLNQLPRVVLIWFGCAVIAAGFLAQPLRRLRARSSDTVEVATGSAGSADSDGADSDGEAAGVVEGGFSGGDVGGSDTISGGPADGPG